jgi:hypothetical protein
MQEAGMAAWLGKIHDAVNFFQVAWFVGACLIGGARLRRAELRARRTSPPPAGG